MIADHEREETVPSADLEPLTGPIPAKVLVYGSGSAAADVVRSLRGEGRTVEAIVDDSARAPAEMLGLPVLSTEQAIGRFSASMPLLLGVFNRAASPIRIAQRARRAGFRTIVPFSSLVQRIPCLEGRYLLDDTSAARRTPDVMRARELLSDRRSRELWDANFALRETGRYAALLEPDGGQQYAGADIAEWNPRPDGAFVDGGAYDGDAIRSMLEAGRTFSAIYAFEPDPASFALLGTALRALRGSITGVAWPCALSDRLESIPFAAGLGESSRAHDGAAGRVLAVRGDDVLAGARVSLIKLDVEGAELQALAGLRETIRRDRPHMAISAYHRTRDLWVLPDFVTTLGPAYKLFLRSHGHGGMDLVLYCVPEEKP